MSKDVDDLRINFKCLIILTRSVGKLLRQTTGKQCSQGSSISANPVGGILKSLCEADLENWLLKLFESFTV